MWQIFVSFCAPSSCKPNNVIVFEYLMSDMGSIYEGADVWGEEEEVCITLTSGAAAPAVPPYLSRYSRLCHLCLVLPFIFNYTLVTCKTHGGTETHLIYDAAMASRDSFMTTLVIVFSYRV